MSREHVGWLVWATWFLIFVACELPAVKKVVPWPTLSATVWGLQQRFEWLSVPILAGLAVLTAHIVRLRNVQQGDSKEGK